jgi:hypothetical protein
MLRNINASYNCIPFAEDMQLPYYNPKNSSMQSETKISLKNNIRRSQKYYTAFLKDHLSERRRILLCYQEMGD